MVGLEPGPHKVIIELADPTHKVLDVQTVRFTLPDNSGGNEKTAHASAQLFGDRV